MTFCRGLAVLSALAALSFSPSVTAFAQTSSLAGDWTGVLTAPGGERHITVHLVKSGDAYVCTIDSPDQGAMGIDCTLDSAVNPIVFEVAIVSGKWTGTLAGDTLTGSWSQGTEPRPLNLTRAGASSSPATTTTPTPPPAVSASGAPDNVTGNWSGAIVAGAATLHINLHLKNVGAAPTCSLDSPDQGANGIACTLKVSANHVDVEVPVVQGHWSGDATPGMLSGTWTQGPNSLPLVFKPAA